jgi:hypothetical protein
MEGQYTEIATESSVWEQVKRGVIIVLQEVENERYGARETNELCEQVEIWVRGERPRFSAQYLAGGQVD